MKLDSKNYLEWFKKAQDDELNGLSILKHRDGAPSGVCFLAQQMAEKYLKGMLVYHNRPFRKIHDLVELETLLREYARDITDLHDDLRLLNRFYVKTRYPGDYSEFFWKDAEEALAAAERVKEFVWEKVKVKK